MAQVVDRRWKKNRTTGEREATGYSGPKPWIVRWRDPDDHQRWKGFVRKADADQYLVSIEHRKLQGDYVDPNSGKVTIRAWCEQWRVMQPHRQSTAEQVARNFRVHVYPVLGDRQLRHLRPSDVQAWVTSMAQTSAPATVALVHQQFAAALMAAEHDRVIGRSPARRTKLPRRPKREVIPPTVEQVEAIADRMPDRYRTLVLLAAGSGLRLGEVLGLQVDRIDFLRRTVRVDQQLLRTCELGPPKTSSSVRTVPVAQIVLDEVAAHLAQFPAVDGLVFTSAMDTPIKQSNLGAMWRRAVGRTSSETTGLEAIRFHDLRHFYASALISAGCSVKAVQKALGHASATETLNTYAHLWPDDQDRTRDAIQAVLDPTSCAQNVRSEPEIA